MTVLTIDDISTYAHIPERHKKELEVLSTGKTYYHITESKNAVDKVKHIPINVPRRTLSTEDNTILRICVADTINNCICAIGGHDNIDMWGINGDKYTIYAITPELIIKPSKKLLPDVEYTNEKWLVNYDGKHDYYSFDRVGEIIGICDYYTENQYILDKEIRKRAVSIYGLNVNVKVQFDDVTILNPGYYKITNTQTALNDVKRKNYIGYRTNIKEENGNIEETIKSYYAIEKIGSYQEFVNTFTFGSIKKFPF